MNSDSFTSTDVFCSRTLQLLGLEREAELSESRNIVSDVSPKVLEKRGVCLTKLAIESRKTSLYGRWILTFKSCNPSKATLPATSISPGDIVGLHIKSKPEQIASGIVTKVSPSSISVAFDQTADLVVVEDDQIYYIVKLANDITYKRLTRALEKLQSYRTGPAQHLIDVIFNQTQDIPPSVMSVDDIHFFNTNLDDSQKMAVQLALTQNNFAIIHGPPGTGKSTTVIEIIRQCVGRGLKVLACAPSNVAVDNLVLHLAKSKVKVTRLGHPARAMHEIAKYTLDAQISASDDNSIIEDIRADIDEALKKLRSSRGTSKYGDIKSLRRELKERSDTAVRNILKHTDVILSTLTSATEDGPLKILDEMHFDIVVIDECSQALEAACWIALTQAPKCILAGDHLQLPPTILSEKAAKEGLSVTLMERLINSHPDHVQMLNVQYRMNKLIMKWSSDVLYCGKLIAHDSVADHLLCGLPGVEENELTKEPLLFIDTAGCDLPELDLPDEQSKGNEGEADLVAIYTNSLISAGVAPHDIAIISPYNLQVELIRSRLSDTHRNLEIKSVDGYQGREKEAVIISLVRSNSKGVVGFLSDDRRLNVAVTRARRQVTIIGDSQTLRKHAFLSGLASYMDTNGKVISAAEYQQDHVIGRPSDQILEIINKQAKSTQKKQKVKSKSKQDSSSSKHFTENERSAKFKQSETAHTSETPEDRDTRLRQEFTSQIEEFLKSNTKSYTFPSSLNSFERMIVHQVAEIYGLYHNSIGEGKDRQIIVSINEKNIKTLEASNTVDIGLTSAKTVVDRLPETQLTVLESSTQVKEMGPSSAVRKEKSRNAASKPKANEPTGPTLPEAFDLKPAAGFQRCEACSKDVPQDNIQLHKLRCLGERKIDTSGNSIDGDNRIKQKAKKTGENDSHTKAKKKNQKKTVSSESALNAVDADDFDALIAAADKLNSVCNFKSCKALVKTLGTNCPFCSMRFCISHGMPEVHGCGDAAKTRARQVISREGKLYNGSGVPNKKPNAVARANLERKLNKKLDEMNDKRKPKLDKPDS